MGAALPFARVEPRLDRFHHHRRKRHFLIERVLADALVKIDREVNRSLSEALAVLGDVLGIASSGGSPSLGTEWIEVCGLATTSESVVEPRTPPPSTSVFAIKRWSASGSGVFRVLGEEKLPIENFFLLLLTGGMENLLGVLFATENGFEFIGDRSDLLSGF